MKKHILELNDEELDCIPILVSLSQIYLWELYNKKEGCRFWEQHKENIDIIKNYHNKGYQGVMAVANNVIEKVVNINKTK